MERVFVYLVLNPKKNEVKIGQTKDIRSRIKSLESEEGTSLILLDIQEDVVPLEKRLHHKFNHLRTHGEWFRLEADLETYIAKRTLDKSPEEELLSSSVDELNYSGSCKECGSPITGKMVYCGQPCKQRAYRKRIETIVV